MRRLVAGDTWGVLTVVAEAGGEPYAGQVAVAEVIQRRARLRYASDGTIAGTVLFPHQFSCWNTEDENRIRVAMLDDQEPVVVACLEAWAEAQSGSDRSQGALCYLNPHTVRVPPPWVARCELVAEIGHHRFYRPLP
jgi:N-acetylmuramoyl-L-alanine amidase